MPTPTESAATNPSDKVPMGEKMAYSVTEIPNFLSGYLPTMLAKQVFNMSMGVSPTLITLGLAILRIFDAFTDPLVGWWSDRFRSRFGRRRPFMFLGVIGIALTLPFLFMVGRDWSHGQLIGWFVGIGMLVYFANTLLNVPYQSLLYEMTPDYHERTNKWGSKTSVLDRNSLSNGR